MIETICGKKALIDTLQKGSGMLRGMPGDAYVNYFKLYIVDGEILTRDS